MSPSKETDIFAEFKEKMAKMNQEILLRSKNGIEQSKIFINLFKENVDWKKKFESIVNELNSMMNTHSSIIKRCKSVAQQQADIFRNCCRQLKFIQSIIENKKNNLDQEHLKSIELAKNRISESLAQIELIKVQAELALENNQKTIELEKKLFECKVESNNDAKELILDYLKKHGYSIKAAASLGAVIGAACGAGILLAKACGLSVSALAGMSAFVVVGGPIVIGVVLFTGVAFAINKYIDNQHEKNKDDIQKSVEEDVGNASKDVENKFSAFRLHKSLESIMIKLDQAQNEISENLKDLKLIIEDKCQRDFFFNSEYISEIINNWEKMQSLLDDIINFVE